MKAKKYGVYISIFIIIIFLIALYFCSKYGKANTVYSNLIIGIIGSAVVTLVLTFTEYLVEKRNALENYFNESHKIWRAFHKIQYFNVSPRVMASAKYLTDCAVTIDVLADDEAAINKLIEFYNENNYWNDYPETLSFEDKKEIAISNAASDEKLILKAMKEYLSFETLSYEGMESSYGKLSFLISSPKIKRSFICWIYNNIHDQMRNMLNEIKIENYHFKLYESERSKNLVVIAEKIKKLNDMLFSTKQSQTTSDIYAQFAYEINDNIEILRAKIYGCKKQEVSNTSVYSIYKANDDEEQTICQTLTNTH